MVKRKVLYGLPVAALAVGAGLFVPSGAWADGDACTKDYEGSACIASSYTELLDGFANPNVGTVTLGDDFGLTAMITSNKDVNFDLAGHTVTASGTLFDITGGLFTMSDSGEGGALTTTMTATNAAIMVEGSSARFSMQSGTINANEVNGSAYGVYALDGASAYVSGGTINTYYGACLSGNNTTGDMNFYVSGGTLNSEVQTIYMPGQVNLNISNGTLNGGVTVRMGQISISGGTINAISKDSNIDPMADYYNYSGMAWMADALTVLGGTYTSDNATYGNSLNVNISGGTFNVANSTGKAVMVYDMGKVEQEMNVNVTGGTFAKAVESAYVTDIVATPASGYGVYTNNPTIVISGGEYAVAPSADEIEPGHEAEETYEGSGVYEIVPINIDWQGDWLEELYNDDYAAYVDFNGSLVADHRASLVASQKTDLSGFSLVNDGDLLMALDIDMVDRDGTRIEVKDNDLRVYIDLSEEDYNALAAYDKIQVVYFDEDGNEVERLDAELFSDNGWYWIEFTTTHLSTYGVVGVNETEEAAAAATPDTGTVTAAGASAAAASILTAAAVGVIAAIVGFAVLVRRK
ncbi:hypothetical protein IKF89_02840 [Candidatus Saccharibacteria bacterium]|nr:hypothetical protein [Candidatus Saccharibacteria bacterium]